MDMPGIAFVEPPADLQDPDAEHIVAEIVRIAGDSLLVEYVALEGRTIEQVRELLASDPTVQAVSEPARGFSPDVEDERRNGPRAAPSAGGTSDLPGTRGSVGRSLVKQGSHATTALSRSIRGESSYTSTRRPRP